MIYCLQMLIKKLSVHKKHILLVIAILWTLLLLYLSFTNVSDFPSTGISFQDKIGHFIFYLMLMLFWNEFISELIKKTKFKNVFLLALSVICLGIILEYLQSELTEHRTTDYFDVVANTLGVIFAVILVLNKEKILRLKLKYL